MAVVIESLRSMELKVMRHHKIKKEKKNTFRMLRRPGAQSHLPSSSVGVVMYKPTPMTRGRELQISKSSSDRKSFYASVGVTPNESVNQSRHLRKQ